MKNPLIERVNSITTSSEQILVLDQTDVEKLQGRNVCIIDDVVSTRKFIKIAVEALLSKIDCKILCKAAVLLEDAGYSGDSVFLEKLPVFRS